MLPAAFANLIVITAGFWVTHRQYVLTFSSCQALMISGDIWRIKDITFTSYTTFEFNGTQCLSRKLFSSHHRLMNVIKSLIHVQIHFVKIDLPCQNSQTD